MKRRELGRQDKALGVAELAQALATGRPFFPPPDFTLHVTELTLAIQGAGASGSTHALETTFEPLTATPGTTLPGRGPRLLDRLTARALERRRRGR